MISINSYPIVKNYNLYNKNSAKTVNTFGGTDVSDYISKGDKALNENQFDEALKSYKTANKQDPSNNKIYKKLAKTYFHMKDYASAQMHYKTYLENAPEDSDGWIEYGETQRKAGFYQKAIESFEQAKKIDPSNDLAQRSILETKNNIVAIYSPERAQKEKNEYAAKNLMRALQMTINYMTPEYMKDLENVQVLFGETASMGGTPNIAQYENHKKAITVSDSYIYAAPQVIAAYLTHESVHAKDEDAYTSVHEEQDAYEVATKFWINHANGIGDPEMDYAANLYKQSPQTLRNRVEEIYKLRDPSIAQTSPNHPPDKFFHWGTKKNQAASQAIKEYNVIA